MESKLVLIIGMGTDCKSALSGYVSKERNYGKQIGLDNWNGHGLQIRAIGVVGTSGTLALAGGDAASIRAKEWAMVCFLGNNLIQNLYPTKKQKTTQKSNFRWFV